MNLSQFRTSIDRRTGVATDSSAQTEWINFVLNEIALEDPWPWLERSTTVTLVVDQNSYALPADVRYVVNVIDSTGTIYDEASIRDLVSFNQQDGLPTRFGEGYFWSADGTQLWISPAPSAAGTLTVRYIANEIALSGDSDAPLLPAAYHQAVVELASMLVVTRRYGDADDRQRAENYQKNYNRIIHKMRREALRRVGVSRVPRIRPGSGV